MSQPASRTLFPLTVVMCLVSLGLTGAGQSIADRARGVVNDASLPGLLLLDVARDKLIILGQWQAPDAEADAQQAALKRQLRDWQSRFRRLQVENGLLNEKLQSALKEGVSPYRAAPTEPLIVPDLLQAAVLGGDSAALFRAGTLIDRGAADGLRESTLVLEESGPLIDQGADAGLASGQPIYAGRKVVGKVGVVGRWTSTIRPLTDSRFRGMAQLARKTSSGIEFGSTGILEGTGEPLCRLKLVPATEAVSIGDEVYTARGDAALPVPLYYGQVVEAELKPGASHWDIRVQPAVEEIKTDTVQILTRSLNPLRQQAN